MADSLMTKLRLPNGAIDLTKFETAGPKHFDAQAATAKIQDELSDLQERLFATGRANPDSAPRLLLVLQGMDTSGKGGTIRHAIGLVDPQGVSIKGFKAPTEEERRHHFLWRIDNALPAPGIIGIFDRSHYEDVLVVRVEELVQKSIWEARYQEINDWEAELTSRGIVIIKCFLHLSKEEQKERLLARLDRLDKYWKYNPDDLRARSKWDQYQEAYEAALTHCNTDVAPWYCIPADRKSYRNWAVAQLLLEHLRQMNLDWPAADFDIEAERNRILAS